MHCRFKCFRSPSAIRCWMIKGTCLRRPEAFVHFVRARGEERLLDDPTPAACSCGDGTSPSFDERRRMYDERRRLHMGRAPAGCLPATRRRSRVHCSSQIRWNANRGTDCSAASSEGPC